MADVQPFRAVRYAGAAGPLTDLVAPPYDVVSDPEREHLLRRSPYNVAHLTLPDSVDEAGRLYAEWLSTGILEREEDASAWLLVEDFVGPDGVARERRGIVASVAAQPYEPGGVLPHERTHGHIREGRVNLLRATHVQPEPVFLLHESLYETVVPERPPDIEVDSSRMWRIPLDGAAFERGELLVADGHHRYESAVELAAELGPSGARITSSPGREGALRHGNDAAVGLNGGQRAGAGPGGAGAGADPDLQVALQAGHPQPVRVAEQARQGCAAATRGAVQLADLGVAQAARQGGAGGALAAAWTAAGGPAGAGGRAAAPGEPAAGGELAKARKVMRVQGELSALSEELASESADVASEPTR